MKRGRPEAGYSLLGLMVGLTIMTILMAVAVPTWRYIIRNEREEELISRLKQIQRAIERYQRKHGAPPVSLDALVEQRFLRRPYKDPMTKAGKWRLVRPGEPCGGGAPGGGGTFQGGGIPSPSPSPSPRIPQSSVGRPPQGSAEGQSFGGIIAVRSPVTEKGLRLVNGQSRYDQWCVQPGQELIVGKAAVVMPALGPSPGTSGARATPLPRP